MPARLAMAVAVEGRRPACSSRRRAGGWRGPCRRLACVALVTPSRPSERSSASPMAVPPPAWIAAIARCAPAFSRLGALDRVGRVRERDDADGEAGGQVLDEALRGLARGRDAVGVDVLREHRAGAVEREHDGALLALGRDGDLGPRHPDGERGERGEQERGRHEPPRRARRLHDLGEHADVAEADRVARLPPAREEPEQAAASGSTASASRPSGHSNVIAAPGGWRGRGRAAAASRRRWTAGGGGRRPSGCRGRPARGPRRRRRRSARAAACVPVSTRTCGPSRDRRGRPRRCSGSDSSAGSRISHTITSLRTHSSRSPPAQSRGPRRSLTTTMSARSRACWRVRDIASPRLSATAGVEKLVVRRDALHLQQHADEADAALARRHEERIGMADTSAGRGGCRGGWRRARRRARRPGRRRPCGAAPCRSPSTASRRTRARWSARARRRAGARAARSCAPSRSSRSGERRRPAGRAAPARAPSRCRATPSGARPRAGSRSGGAPSDRARAAPSRARARGRAVPEWAAPERGLPRSRHLVHELDARHRDALEHRPDDRPRR